MASADFGVVMIRAERPYPSTAELCSVFAHPYVSPLEGVLCPISLCDGKAGVRGVVPVVVLGFSVADGKLSGSVDRFDNLGFDVTRTTAGKIAGFF